MILLFRLEKAVLEYYQVDYRARYIGVGQVEYRAKEVIIVVDQEI